MKPYIVKTPSFMYRNDERLCAFAEEQNVECIHTIDINENATLEDTFEAILEQFKTGRFTFDGARGFFTVQQIEYLNSDNSRLCTDFFVNLAEYIDIAFISRRKVEIFTKETLQKDDASDLGYRILKIAVSNEMSGDFHVHVYEPTKQDFENEDKIILAFVEYACNLEDETTAAERLEEFKSNLAIVRSEREDLILTDLPPDNLSWAVGKCQEGKPDFFEKNIGVLDDIKKVVSW